MTPLTAHFSLEELTFTDHREFDNTPPPSAVSNLYRVALLLEQLRTALGNRPIIVNSGYRSPQVNAAVGSRPTSQHLLGCAADIRVLGMTPDEVMRVLMLSGIAYDQAIREFDRWVHLSVPSALGASPRRQALIIDRDGTRAYSSSRRTSSSFSM